MAHGKNLRKGYYARTTVAPNGKAVHEGSCICSFVLRAARCLVRRRSRDTTETPPPRHSAAPTGQGDIDVSCHSATLRAVEDYTHKYKGEQVEVELFGGEYQDGTLTAYCGIEGVRTSS